MPANPMSLSEIIALPGIYKKLLYSLYKKTSQAILLDYYSDKLASKQICQNIYYMKGWAISSRTKLLKLEKIQYVSS